MGYTHYFPQTRSFTDNEWSELTKTVKKLIKSARPVNLIMGGCGEGKPIINTKEICFNGNSIDDQGHETFQITKEHNTEFNFCKTARKPYDAYVVAVLCLADRIAPNALKIGSDGNAAEWGEGLRLAQTFDPQCTVSETVNQD